MAKVFYRWEGHTIRKVDANDRDILHKDAHKKPTRTVLIGPKKIRTKFTPRENKHHGRKEDR